MMREYVRDESIPIRSKSIVDRSKFHVSVSLGQFLFELSNFVAVTFNVFFDVTFEFLDFHSAVLEEGVE